MYPKMEAPQKPRGFDRFFDFEEFFFHFVIELQTCGLLQKIHWENLHILHI